MQHQRDIILGAINGDSTKEAELIKLCSSIAQAYLKTKYQKHSFLFKLNSLSIEDFAMDCIAELFEKREGTLIVFKKWESERKYLAKESEFSIHLRKLVCRKVNDHIFRMYNEYDPSLGKIIRNLKRGITSGDVEGIEISKNGKCIQLTEITNSQEVFSYEFLRIKLAKEFKKVSSITDVLRQLRGIFEIYEELSPSIEITSLGLMIRELFSTLQFEEEPSFARATTELEEAEIQQTIDKAIEKTKKELFATYVLKDKISEGDFSGYFMTVRNILVADFKENEHSGKSYFEHYNFIFGQINKEIYRSEHRKYLEYFVKITRKTFIRYIKVEFNSATVPIWKES